MPVPPTINATLSAYPSGGADELHQGVTKLEFFSVLALQGLCAFDGNLDHAQMATKAIRIANALILALPPA